MSICRNVSASEGGAEMMPLANANCLISIESTTSGKEDCASASLSIIASPVAATIPQSIEPRTLRACSTAVVNKPTKNTIKSGEAKCAFSFTAEPGSLMISPVFCKPMNAMNSPMPAAMPFFRLGEMALKIISRNPISERIRNKTPEIKTQPSATCQPFAKPAAVAAGITENTKKKFSPMPGAWAMGYRASKAMSAVASAAARQVAVITAPKSMPVFIPNIAPDSTAGCTTMM